MRPRFLVTAATALIVASLFSPAPVRAASNLLFILDSSGSMWGRIDGKAKMETAKAALSKLVGDLPKDTKVGLMVYGAREKKSCTDVETMIKIGPADPKFLNVILKVIAPHGKTPIAYSLEQSSSAFAGLKKGNNNVVLISDGIETCDGDPCAVAGELAKSNVNVRVHVVGFDISEKDRKQLECIAKAGKGKYFAANSTEGFTKAVTEAVKVAQAETKPVPAPAPPPAPPKPVIYFEDNFDGEELGEHWEVVKPNPDAFIVEDGFLNILTAKELTLHNKSKELPNLFKLTKPMPRGDWVATMRVKPSITTFREMYAIALYTDKNKFLDASAWAGVDARAGHAAVNLGGNKFAGGSITSFHDNIYYSKKALGNGNVSEKITAYTELAAKEVNAILLRIRKTGKSYFVSGKVEGDASTTGGKKPQWVELQKLTSLRSPGKFLAISMGEVKFDNSRIHLRGGETLVRVDWIKIETKE